MKRLSRFSARTNAVCAWTITFVIASSLPAQVNVTTQHNDISRTGQNTNETLLTPQNVNAATFGKLFSVPVDGSAEAQPLYLSAVNIAGKGTHNVVYVATEHDSVYAFDADSPQAPLWQATFLDAAHGAAAGAIPEPSSDTDCTNISPQYGVTGTPVIDASTGTLYVVAVTSEYGYPVQRLHALDVTTGLEKFNGPVVIQASVPGTGTGSSYGVLSFDPKWQFQRAGLLLVNNTIYMAFAAHCDYGPFHGWVMGYDAGTLAQTGVFVTSPNGSGSGIWMAGGGLAADTSGTYPRIFVPTGNGSFDATTPYSTNTMDYGDDILALTLNKGISVSDAFTPYNQALFSSVDGDVASGGVIILPDQSGPYKHLAVQLGKSGSIYLMNRDNLGGFSSSTNNIVQEVDNQVSGLFGMPAFWNGNLYIWASGGYMRQFTLTNGALSSTFIAQASEYNPGLGNSPSVSANGITNGIVWAIDSSGNPEVLYAHDAGNVANTLYSSNTNAARDGAGERVKFSVPTVANGKVYVGGAALVNVYGLLPAADFTLSGTAGPVTVSAGSTGTDSLSISPLYGFSGPVSLSASGLPSGVTASFTTSTATKYGLTLSASASAPAGNYSVTINASSGSQTHSLAVNLQVLSSTQPDFSLTASPATVNLLPGALAVSGIVVTPLNGFSGVPSFTVSGLPAGVNASFSAAGATYYVMGLTSPSDVVIGTEPLLVTATSGSIVRSVAFTLVVGASPNFTAVELVPNNSNKCLSVSGNSSNSGALDVQATCTGAAGQVWNLIALGGSNYKIVSASSGLALSVSGSAYASGTQLAQQPYTEAPGQVWGLIATPWGFDYVVDAVSGQCLDVAGASNADGAVVDQTGCTGTTNQMWSILPVHNTVQVNLSSFYNAYAIVTDGTYATNGGLGLGYALSASNTGAAVSWNENPFSFGPVNFANAVSNSSVTLPTGQFSSLQFLATSVYGSQLNESFSVTYTDGTSTTVQQSFSDWGNPGNYAGESQAIVMPYRITPLGARSYGSWSVYGYSVALNGAKTVQSIQLPGDPNIFVLAITLVK